VRKTIEILNSIEKDHSVKELVMKGVLSWTTLYYRDMYNEYDIYRRLGNNVNEAVLLTSVKMNVDRSTVYRAIKRMES